MEYIYRILNYMTISDKTNETSFAKPSGYKNINTSTMGKKCGNR